MNNIPGAVGLVAVALLAARLAQAGIADSPLPVLTAGAKTLHLYSVAERDQRRRPRHLLRLHVH